MAIIRMLTDQEFQEAVRLADAIFRDEEQPSMGEAFPHIFADSINHVSFGAFEDGQLLTFLGLVPWTIRIGEASLRVFSLGSVCTHPDARGKGLAGEVLAEIYRYIREAGASILLVSGTRTLYTRTGCATFGRCRRYGLDPATADLLLQLEQPSSLKIREMVLSDIFDMYDIASIRNIRYELGVNELGILMKVESLASCIKMKHRVLAASNGETLTAFAVIGVPDDPQRRGLMVEYAGDEAAVVRLAAHAVKNFSMAGLDLPVPWHENELHARLSEVPSSEENNSGTLRIVNGQALIAQLRPWLERKAAGRAAGFRLEERQDGTWLFDTGTQRLTLSADELVRLIFDHAGKPNADDPTALSLQGMFPVPFPYTAGLAYI